MRWCSAPHIHGNTSHVQDIADQRAEKNNVRARPQRQPEIRHGRSAAETRINMNDFCALLARSITHWKPTGWFSAIDEPMIRMASEYCRSCCAVVAPPRPYDVPRPGTVELCHIRA